jgi:WS/DGAT/MGAT family acyltransferase
MRSRHEPLTAADTAWFRMEERGNPVDITCLMLFDGPLAESRLREVLERRLLGHRRFRERVVDTRLGVAPPHWEDEPDFSIDHHLERVSLPAPGGTAELEALLDAIVSEPMDLSRSPWRVTLVDGLSQGTALVSRIHHCMGDGFALMHILLSLTDSDDAEPAPHPTRAREARAPSRPPLTAASHAVRDGLAALGHLLLLPFDPPTRLRSPLGGKRRARWSAPIPLALVKRIGRARSATVNDVLLSALTGALRRYLADRGDPVDALTLRAIVPVNLRPPDQPVDLEHGNWFGLVFVDLPISATDPDERAEATKTAIDRIKGSLEAVVSLAVINAMGRAPAAVEHVLEDVFGRKGSLVATNVPGPRAPLRLAGSRIRDMVFWAPHSGGLGLGVSILSYAGNIRVGIRADTAVVPDPTPIARYFEEELAVLETRSRDQQPSTR